MAKSRKDILVTGAAGFIGSHVAEQLLAAGHRVTAFIRYTSTGTAGFLESLDETLKPNLRCIAGDIRNRDDVCRAVSGSDTVIHLAAHIAIPYSYLAPDDFLLVNAGGTMNLLQAAREAGTSRIVLLSTSEVYGTARYTPIDENHPQVAQSPYSASKIAADKIGESFHRSFGLPVVIARPFNTYGPRQSARAVIPTIILQALRGNTVKLGNVDTRRDLNFVKDTAAALNKIALSKKGVGEQVNICSGIDYSIADIVARVADRLGKKLTIKTDRRRVRPKKSEVSQLLGDGSKAEKLFGLPKKTTIEEGLRQTIAYYEARLENIKQEDYQL